MLKSFLLSFVVASAWSDGLVKRLTNQDIIDMTSLGLSEEIIVSKIRSANGTDGVKFDTSVDSLQTLKAAKVSDAVIKAMISPPPPSPTPITVASAPVSADPNLPPAEVGVYWRDGSTFTFIEGRAISQAKVGGRIGSFVTYGMRGQHWDAYLAGSLSSNHVKDRRPVFYFYVPEGASAADYVLIKLDKKGDRRQFQIGSFGGMKGGESGVKKEKQVPVRSEHVGTRTYKVTLDHDLAPGEYAFFMGTGQQATMASGQISAGSGGSATGRVFDFNIPD
jgi:hypothetical protein